MTISEPNAPEFARVIEGLQREINRLRSGRRLEILVLGIALLLVLALGISVLGHPEFGTPAILVLGAVLLTGLVLLELRVLRANRRIAEKQRALHRVSSEATKHS